MRRVDAVLHHLHLHPIHPCALTPHPTSSSPSPPPTPITLTSSPLDLERSSSSFPTLSLTHFLDGDPSITTLKAAVASLIESDPILNPPPSFSPSPAALASLRRSCMAKIVQCTAMVRAQVAALPPPPPPSPAPPPSPTSPPSSLPSPPPTDSSRAGIGQSFEDAFYALMSLADPAWSIRTGVHYGLFRSSIMSQGSAAQRAVYTPLIADMRVIGSFAMTELGHGSNVAAIETEARWMPAEAGGWFELHSPTVTSTKWWIGGAAEMSTHCAVYARLLVEGRDLGLHCFVVHLRDEEGHVTRGVTVGDMGAKMGRDGLDNGYVRFHHLRLPPSALLQRWTAVTEDGRFVQQAASGRTTYVALVQTRVELLVLCSDVLKQSVTIAVRYACVRKQGWRGSSRSSGGGERKGEEVTLMDYETHQRRLIPILASALATQFTAKAVQTTVARLVTSLSSSLTPPPSVLASLESVHATTCGLKAFATWYVNDAVEVCRQSLGGQGYSAHAWLPRVRNDWAVMCTWEGDNTVLALQCAKHMLRMTQGKKVEGGGQEGKGSGGDEDPFDYLVRPEEDVGEATPSALSSPQWLVRVMRVRAHRSLQRLLMMASSSQELLETRASACIDVARAHCDHYQLQCFASVVASAPDEVAGTLTDLLLLSGHTLLLSSSSFLPCSPLPASSFPAVASLVSALLVRLRPVVVPLTDAFALPDFVLGPLGRYDGRVYDALYEAVRGSGEKENAVVEYWAELVKPMLTEPPAEREHGSA